MNELRMRTSACRGTRDIGRPVLRCWDAQVLAAGALFVWVCAFGPSLEAASPMRATSSRQARDEAIHAIPWRSLSAQQRRAVQSVIRDNSIYRRLPTRVIDCDVELFTFLMQHPEVVAGTWQTMGVSKLKIDHVGQQTYQAQDGLGTTGRFSYLDTTWGEAAANRVVIYAEGAFEGKPFNAPINARCVLLLRSGSVEETNGRTYVTAQLDSFLSIDQIGVELVAKTIQPLVGKAADQNFIETLRFVSSFSRAAEKNPAAVEQFSHRLASIDAATRHELIRVCYTTAERYAKLRRERLGQQVSVVGPDMSVVAQ